MTWTAEPGIDLTTGAAVVVRAYLESYYLAYITTDEKYLYPGFQQSVDANQPEGTDGTTELWPKPSRPKTWVGTARQHLLRIERSDRDVTAVGCMYSYGSAVQTEDGFDPNVGGIGPDAGVSAVRIGLRAPANDDVVLPPQQGPSRAPFDNVFGGWRVTNHQGGFILLAQWDGAADDEAECVSRADRAPENRTFTPGGAYPRADFPTLPATPGWPADPSTPPN